MRAPGSAIARMVALGGEGGGALSALGTSMRAGRFSVSTLGFDPLMQGIGSDADNSPSYTGLQVPAAGTTGAQQRYLFQLCRARFQKGDKVRLVGMKQYVDLAVLYNIVDGATTTLTFPVVSPLWRFPDGNISWHVMLVPTGWRDTRSSTNADSLMFRDSRSAALLYESLGPYVPPNAGRPYGKPLPSCDLGNMHDLRYPWRDSQSERELSVPIPTPCDVVAYASVWQTGGFFSTAGFQSQLTAGQQAALSPEDRFATMLSAGLGIPEGSFVRYNRIAAQLTFEGEMTP